MSEMKPMLAAEAIPGEVKYPKLASPKLNGVRALIKDGKVYARSLKLIPNLHVQKLFGRQELNGLDGELIVGPFHHKDVFTTTTSGVMSVDGEPDVRLYVFDRWDLPAVKFHERVAALNYHLFIGGNLRVQAVQHDMVFSDEAALAFMDACVLAGYEGAVLRDPDAGYKFGRSTELEGGFLRLTPWHTSEGELVAVKEGMTNMNPAVKNELGRTKRSQSKENLVPNGKAGAICLKDLKTGVLVWMGVRDEAEAHWMWQNRDAVRGRIGRYKFKTPIKGDMPRFPQFEGFRDERDLSC